MWATGVAVRAPRAAALSAAIGGLIGLAAFEASLGLALVEPNRIGWLMVAPGDFSTHFLGWHFFRGEPWRWPPGATRSFIYPMGTSVGLTDSIPLLAIPLKALSNFLSDDFQYLGFWLMCSFVLQGAFGALLMQTRTSQIPLHALASALFVLAPPLLARHGHTALTAHWLLLACLWVYASCEDARHHRRAFRRLSILVIVAAAVHPYLALMVLALCTAYYGRVVLLTPRRWLGGALLPLAALMAVSGLVFWQSGYLILRRDALQAGGLGEYSMNALAPIMPMGNSWLLPDYFGAAMEGQYEGFAYFGAGMLVLGSIALAKRIWDRAPIEWSALAAHLPLVTVCTLVTIVALSPRVTVGDTTVLHYSDAIWGPLRQFRASGRFVWPAYYALMVVVIATTIRRFTRLRALILLATAVALQSVDAAGAFAYARGLREMSWRSPLRTEQFWAGALPHYRHVSLYPTNLCAAPLVALDYPGFGLVAGRFRTTLNAGHTARLDPARVREYCQYQAAERDAGIVDPSTLYVMSIRLALEFGRRAVAPAACIDVDEFGVCFARDTYLQWQDSFDIDLAMLPPLPELARFRDALDAEYRDGLNRAPQRVHGSSDERVRAIAKFVGYRLTGCDREEAAGKIVRELSGARELRLCTQHRARRLSALENPDRPEPWPARDETVQLLRDVDEMYRRQSRREEITTHVDAEGEAVWLQEYLRHRLAGRLPTEAKELVLQEIRTTKQ